MKLRKTKSQLKKGDLFVEHDGDFIYDYHVYLGTAVEGGLLCFHATGQNFWFGYDPDEIMVWEFLCSILPNDSAGNLVETETPAEQLWWNPETETYGFTRGSR